MIRAERITGILSAAFFSLGLLCRYQLWPGGSILLAASLGTFVFGYLTSHYMIQHRTASSLPDRLFLILKFITYSMLMTGAVMGIQHWPGGHFLLGMGTGLAACQIFFYFYLRNRGSKRSSSHFNDMVVAVLGLGIFIYMSNPRTSKYVLEGHQLILDQYEKQNAGIESALRIIYESADSISFEEDPDLKEGIRQLKKESKKLYAIHDSLRRGFILFCNLEVGSPINASSTHLHPLALSSGDYGTEYFLNQHHGQELKKAIAEYMEKIRAIVQRYNLSSGLIGLGLDVGDISDAYGNSKAWETLMFDSQRVSSVMNNLLWIKQMILRTEDAVLEGLISQADLSGEMKYLQELAARESTRAMDVKESELVRIRQQQELQVLQLEQNEAVLKQRKVTIILAFSGIAFVLILLVISTRAFYLKRRDNKRLAEQKREITAMNQALNERNDEIMAQNDEILAQRDEIEAQRDMVTMQKDMIVRSHGEISSSIDYARRLQDSILPSPALLNTRIADHFVLLIPKHRVSGDFYWWTQIEDHVVITAVDCTGHGVPGAFMSMLGVSMLREIVSKEYISHPGVILRRLRKEVMHALKQTGEFGEQKDGMDMALVSINVETLECQYAGANNSLYLVREGQLTEYKPDRMPIAIHQNMDKFTTHDIQLQAGDHLYLFSDGYVDQFGGPDDKKFKFTRFRRMLTDNASLPMKEQKMILENSFLEWKGEHEQVDDIVVLGLEL
jgi:serine phosphatase RsbU (regulator of sigma subunit)